MRQLQVEKQQNTVVNQSISKNLVDFLWVGS